MKLLASVRGLLRRSLWAALIGLAGAVIGEATAAGELEAGACQNDACDAFVGSCFATDLESNCDEISVLECVSEWC